MDGVDWKALLDIAAHRPWPLPARGWRTHMSWHGLLFAHWPVPPDALRPLLPPGLELDTFEGTAWLGVVPFSMTNVGFRWWPWLPFASAFHELNVRTYVTAGGKPGVWFFSLDAGSAFAVWGARRLGMNYFRARMTVRSEGTRIRYLSTRTHRDAPPLGFDARYGPTGPRETVPHGSLAEFLTERYCLYATSKAGRLYRIDIHHPPWPLQPAEAEIPHNDGGRAHGITLPDTKPLLHFASRLDVLAWTPDFDVRGS